MKSLSHLTAKFLLIGSLFLASCGSAAADNGSSPITQSTSGQTNGNATESTAAPRPTREPTATVWPPVFDPYAGGDIRDLDSFVVTVDEKNTVNGDLTERTFEIGYIKEPFSAYQLLEFSGGVQKVYIVDGNTYEDNGYGDWYLSAYPDDNILYGADISSANTENLVDAQFDELEMDYEGIPAYHFVLEPTTSTTDNGSTVTIEGEYYVAQPGNYVLYSHWKETSAQGDFHQVFEVTETLSSINQLAEITLTGEFLEMQTALNLPVELKLPLPADTNVRGMIRYKSGSGISTYTLTTPQTSIDEFLDYYRNLAPTDGWTVTHVGHVNLHQDDCEFTRECVMLKHGSLQVILYYNGGDIRAEFDTKHLYSPLN